MTVGVGHTYPLRLGSWVTRFVHRPSRGSYNEVCTCHAVHTHTHTHTHIHIHSHTHKRHTHVYHLCCSPTGVYSTHPALPARGATSIAAATGATATTPSHIHTTPFADTTEPLTDKPLSFHHTLRCIVPRFLESTHRHSCPQTHTCGASRTFEGA